MVENDKTPPATAKLIEQGRRIPVVLRGPESLRSSPADFAALRLTANGWEARATDDSCNGSGWRRWRPRGRTHLAADGSNARKDTD